MDKFFKDDKGKIAVWQSPNLPLWTWFISTIALKLIKTGKLHDLLQVLAFGAIFTWAYLEIRSGVSYFRRALGLVVLIASVYSKVKS